MAEEQSRSPNLAELLRVAMENRLLEVHTSLPGRVEKINASTQTVDVKPLIKRRYADPDGTEVDESLPVIPRVPLAFPRAGNFKITWPIRKGDLVDLVFTETSRDNFKAGDGGEVDPDDFRRFDLSDAVAYPGGHPESKALTDFSPDHIEIGTDGGVIVSIHSDEIHLGSRQASDALALASKVKSELDTLQGNYDTHTHLYLPGPGGAIATAVPVPLNGPVGPVDSSIVKAD
jgi:hypothetical protein